MKRVWLLLLFFGAAFARYVQMTAEGGGDDGDDAELQGQGGPPVGKKSETDDDGLVKSFDTDSDGDTESEMWSKQLELMANTEGDDVPKDPKLMDNNVLDSLQKELQLMELKEADDKNKDDEDDDEKVYIQDTKAEVQWNNKYRKHLYRNCGGHGGIYYVYSHFHRSYTDRVWNWGCRKVTNEHFRYCSWSGNENARRGNMNFACPANQVLTSVWAYYVGAANDRVWRFLCCETPRRYTSNCMYTQLSNRGGDYIWHHVGAPRVFTGAYSIYDHRTKDRVWKFKICEYGPSPTCDRPAPNRT